MDQSLPIRWQFLEEHQRGIEAARSSTPNPCRVILELAPAIQAIAQGGGGISSPPIHGFRAGP